MATTTNTTIADSCAISSADQVSEVLSRYREEWSWLADFLTGDELLASACIAEVFELSNNHRCVGVDQSSLQMCARECTIRVALDCSGNGSLRSLQTMLSRTGIRGNVYRFRRVKLS